MYECGCSGASKVRLTVNFGSALRPRGSRNKVSRRPPRHLFGNCPTRGHSRSDSHLLIWRATSEFPCGVGGFGITPMFDGHTQVQLWWCVFRPWSFRRKPNPTAAWSLALALPTALAGEPNRGTRTVAIIALFSPSCRSLPRGRLAGGVSHSAVGRSWVGPVQIGCHLRCGGFETGGQVVVNWRAELI